MKTIKDFISVVDHQTVIVTLLAVATTYACQYFGILANIPTGLIGLAVVFPIVFSINAAYKRREEALGSLAGIKAHLVALYFVHRDWIPGQDGKESEHCSRIRRMIQELLEAMRDDLATGGKDQAKFYRVYACFSEISASHEILRQGKTTAGELHRANQYLSKIMIDFERMHNIATYRTPVTLRAYSRVFLNTFPIAFGPYFASLCEKSDAFPGVGYMVAVLYSLVLVTLDNLQEDLEDPFDGVGADDIQLDIFEQYKPMVEQ